MRDEINLFLKCACLIRVPVEVVKQRAQVRKEFSLYQIAKSSFQNEVCLDLFDLMSFPFFGKKGFLGFYRGYFATLSREIPFSIIQFPLWEFFKVNFHFRNFF